MLKRPVTVKEWTEVVTAWLQVLGLFAAGIFALVEYQGRKEEVKVQRAVDYLASADSEILIKARLKLSENEQRNIQRYDEILLNTKLPQDEINTNYYQFVVDELVMYNKDPGLKAEFGLILGYLDEGVVCSEEDLCSKKIITSHLSQFGKTFVRTYTPYLCFLRRAWNDPSIGKRVEKFYNPTAADNACSEFYKSIANVSKAKVATMKGKERTGA